MGTNPIKMVDIRLKTQVGNRKIEIGTRGIRKLIIPSASSAAIDVLRPWSMVKESMKIKCLVDIHRTAGPYRNVQ